MALGGGSWLTQNKVLPGSYINFASLAKASAALSDRGIAASGNYYIIRVINPVEYASYGCGLPEKQ